MILTGSQKKVLEDALAKKTLAENEYKKTIYQLNNIVVAIVGIEGGQWNYENGELIIIDAKQELKIEEQKPEESK